MLALWFGAILIGFAPILVKTIHLGPTTIGFYRCGIGAAFLLLLSISRGKLGSLKAKTWRYIFLAGALFAADLYCWHRSVIFAGAGIGTILANTQVFYISLFGWWVHKEKSTLGSLLVIGAGFIGIFLLVWFREGAELSFKDDYWLGIIFGLGTGVLYASYVITLRRLEVMSQGLFPIFRLGLVSASSGLVLLVLSYFEGSLESPNLSDVPAILTLAILIQGIAWLLISGNLPKVSVSRAGLLLLSQPLVATLAGAYLFHERLSPLQICGAVITLGAILLNLKMKPSLSASP